mmetsp:Transcript_18400/g.42310  ORF Transcript_18400/g.42310 Transcript_18400/m.42310 type:complete len:239 (+) Transcript_18400:1074-1790(+)
MTDCNAPALICGWLSTAHALQLMFISPIQFFILTYSILVPTIRSETVRFSFACVCKDVFSRGPHHLIFSRDVIHDPIRHVDHHTIHLVVDLHLARQPALREHLVLVPVHVQLFELVALRRVECLYPLVVSLEEDVVEPRPGSAAVEGLGPCRASNLFLGIAVRRWAEVDAVRVARVVERRADVGRYDPPRPRGVDDGELDDAVEDRRRVECGGRRDRRRGERASRGAAYGGPGHSAGR